MNLRISFSSLGGLLAVTFAVLSATVVAAAPTSTQQTLGHLLTGVSSDNVGARVYSNSTLRGDSTVVLQVNDDPATALDVICMDETTGNGSLNSVVYYSVNGGSLVRLDRSLFVIECSPSAAVINIDARDMPTGTVYNTRFMLTHESGIVTASWKNLNKKAAVTSQGQDSQQVTVF